MPDFNPAEFDPNLYPKMLDAFKSWLQGGSPEWPRLLKGFYSDVNNIGPTNEYFHDPARNMYQGLMDQIYPRASGTPGFAPNRQVPFGENASNFPADISGGKFVPGKVLSWLTNDVGNRVNVESGMGDLLARYMAASMAQSNPELMQWSGLVPPPTPRYD